MTPSIPALDRVYMSVSPTMACRILSMAWHYGPGCAEVLGEWPVSPARLLTV